MKKILFFLLFAISLFCQTVDTVGVTGATDTGALTGTRIFYTKLSGDSIPVSGTLLGIGLEQQDLLYYHRNK